MGLPGREPNPDSINRNKPAMDWTDVENKPYAGKRPTLPATRTYTTPDGPQEAPLNALTKSWWEAHTKMPHCILWTPTDWDFAVQTALLADMFYSGQHTVATELRNRLKVMGATHDARVSQRIRYVDKATDPKTPAKTTARAKTKGKTATVTNIDERRLRARTG